MSLRALKKKKANPQVSLQEEILKIKTEINEMETNKITKNQ